MKKIKLQKKYIFLILALTIVSVVLAISLFIYQITGSQSAQSIPMGVIIVLLIFLILLPILLVIFLFVRKTKAAQWLGFSIISIAIALIALLLFVAGGVSDTRAKIIFSSGSSEKVYDGTPLECDKWQQTRGKLEIGHSAIVTIIASRTDSGSSPNYFTVSIRDESNQDVTDNYNIESQPGELHVLAPKIGIKSGSASKEYDAIALVSDNYKISSGNIIVGQKISVQVSGQRIDAGISDNTFDATIMDANGQDVTHNYSIEKLFGKLEVSKRKISISTQSYHGVYDARTITYKEWSYASDTKIIATHKIEVVVGGMQTDVGISKNYISELKITEGIKNVTANYAVTYLEGDLIVTPRKITLRSESGKKNYDGTPLTNSNWEYASQTRLADNQTINVVISGTRTEPGESENTIAEALIRTAEGKDVSFNYDIKLQEGSLIVVGDNPSTDPGTGGEPGESSLDESGTIGSDMVSQGGQGEGDSSIAASVYSENSANIYLRYMNFGDFDGTKWAKANSYSTFINPKYSLNYLTGAAIENAGYKSSAVSIKSFSSNYLLPYYLDMDNLSYQIQSNDVKNEGNTDSMYSAYYYQFNYEKEGLGAKVPESFAAYERDYFNYVKSVYLSIPIKTNEFLSKIIYENDFKNNPNMISTIAEYIRNAAVYNVSYDRNLDKGDIVENFLSEYKQGICQHFATAATMLYRALGIPARYVIGYAGETKSGEWVDFTANEAHAWVEVYVSGIGWVQVEVTPSGRESSGDGESSGGTGDQAKKLNIKPIDCAQPYTSGAVLTPENKVQGLSELLAKGYNYTAVITGKQTIVGVGYSVINSFVLYDSKGADVTNQFNFVFGKGKLHLFIRELTVTTESLSKIYDGSPLRSKSTDGISWEGKLITDHSMKIFEAIGSVTDVGQRENVCNIKIVDKLGDDVTFMYRIINNYGTLTVNAREIVLKAGSASKRFDKTELTCSEYEITANSDTEPLGQGDIISVQINGGQTNPGSSQNEIASVKIVNKHGAEVTGNYSIHYLSGWLIVTL